MVRSILSNSVRLCARTLQHEQLSFVLFQELVYDLINRYSKLSVGVVLKNIVSPFLTVDNPTKSFEILFQIRLNLKLN